MLVLLVLSPEMANKLPWFTHDHDAHEDTWIRNIVRKQGHEAGWIWWVLIELHHKHGVGDVLTRDISDIARSAMTSGSVITRVLTEMATEFEGQTKVRWNLVGTELRLEIKKLRERQSKLKSKIPSTLRQPSVNLPIEVEEDKQEEKKKEVTPAALKPKIVKPESKAQHDIRRIIEAYKLEKGVKMDDKSWDKANFGRYAKTAANLLACFGQDVEKCAAYIFLRAEDLNEKRLDWTLETITRHAFDGIGIPKKEDNNGHEAQSLGADSLPITGRTGRFASSRSLAGDALRAIELSAIRPDGGGDMDGPEPNQSRDDEDFS